MIPKKIIIIGGGTAGWMAANLMAHAWADKNINITLVESKSVGTVGVGEGTTPFIRNFFKRLGIEESEWMPACNATYKCGISFPHWSTVPGYENYFHPFYSEIDTDNAIRFFKACYARRMGYSADVNPNAFFVTSELARERRAPTRKDGSQMGLDYGYHFDAELLGCFLRDKARARGITCLEDQVQQANVTADGTISSILTENHGELDAEFFVDCSGFKGLLIQKALGEKHISYSHHLFNDRAIAIPTAHNTNETALPSETVSRALRFGWAWHIPLMNRVGNGYVYCSDYVSEDEAEAEFRRYLGVESDQPMARHIRWTPGRINEHWKANCVAIGLSQGFLEPLEAPMLNVIQRSCEDFVELFEKGDFSSQYREEFNDNINTLIDGTRDYLQAHYKLNSRIDSQYWIDNRDNANLSPSLKRILDAWATPGSFDDVLAEVMPTQVYLKTSWYCLLAGMGQFGPSDKPEPVGLQQLKAEARRACMHLARDFYDHSDWLKKIYQQ
jgi:2-polyprenyl-6-methoxyphenol hydroxylase-like FAD-dependent oxidoreductase